MAAARVARATSRVNTVLLLVPGRAVPVGARLAVAAFVRALLTVAVVAGSAAAVLATEPSPLLAGALGVLLSALALAAAAAVVLPAAAGLGPVVSARDHHRALARRAVPRLRDPDAPGRTRSRAPSGPVPAVP